VALWQAGMPDYVGPELNRAFVNNDERLDPAMAALAHDLGVFNVELRASEKSAARGVYKYIAQLLDNLNGNLLELGGAYNAGPGAVNRWLTTKAGKDDPLLFVESIPVSETRSYVKRLMLYHWLYRRRSGQEADSLDQTARGNWPIYRPAQSVAKAQPVQAPSPLIPVAAGPAMPVVVQSADAH
jgi:hypothetical protein